MTSTDETEPKGSASSSPDDFCSWCKHHTTWHRGGARRPCDWTGCDCDTYVSTPAEPEPAEECSESLNGKHCRYHLIGDPCCLCGKLDPAEPQPSEDAPQRIDPDCIRPEGCVDKLKRRCNESCQQALTELTWLRERMKPEPPPAEEPECREPEGCHRVIPCDPGCAVGSRLLHEQLAEPPRRPPYAVAYATEGGAQYEIALPGDATIRAVDGALIITHAGAILALTQARPMES